MDIEYTIDIGAANFRPCHDARRDSSGGTADQARTALDEALRLFLTTAAGKCLLEEVLREAGYELERGAG
jgi:hypothetical protein